MPTATVEMKRSEVKGAVYCPLCTHTVDANVTKTAKGTRVVAGQRCPRCSSSLDAGYVIRADRAA